MWILRLVRSNYGYASFGLMKSQSTYWMFENKTANLLSDGPVCSCRSYRRNFQSIRVSVSHIYSYIYIYIYYLPVNPRRLYSWINLIQQWPFLCSLFHGCTVAMWLARRKMKMTFFPRTKLWLVDSYSTAIKNSINGITAPDLFESEFRSVMRAMQPVVVFMTSSEQILQ